jgi:hypothetical protein
MSNLLIHDLHDIEKLDTRSMAQIHGAMFKRNGMPGYTAPTVLYDDGINVQTTDPLTSNVAYDSPFTPIPRPA